LPFELPLEQNLDLIGVPISVYKFHFSKPWLRIVASTLVSRAR